MACPKVFRVSQPESENAVTREAGRRLAEKLLSNARLIEELDFQGKLNRDLLLKITQENQIFRANVFNKSGERIISNSPGLGLGFGHGGGNGMDRKTHDYLLKAMQQDGNEELVMGFGQRRFGAGKRFAVARINPLDIK